jgi:hypothetical protein
MFLGHTQHVETYKTFLHPLLLDAIKKISLLSPTSNDGEFSLQGRDKYFIIATNTTHAPKLYSKPINNM